MADTPKIVVIVEGGIIQNILTNRLENPMVLVVDWDNAKVGGPLGDVVYDPVLEYNPEEVELLHTGKHPDLLKYEEEIPFGDVKEPGIEGGSNLS